MHGKHGYALEKLIHPQTGKVDMLAARPLKAQQALKAKHQERLAACEDEDACIYIENEEIGYDEDAAWWYGFVVGSQYKEDSQVLATYSNCFYMSYSLIESMDQWWINILDFTSTGQWFNIIFYDLLMIYNNIEGAYEYCTFNQYLDQVIMLANLDYAYMADLVVRESVILATEVTTFTATYYDYIDDDNKYEAGKEFGKFWKEIFDTSIQDE
jgi:hypothetical protein